MIILPCLSGPAHQRLPDRTGSSRAFGYALPFPAHAGLYSQCQRDMTGSPVSTRGLQGVSEPGGTFSVNEYELTTEINDTGRNALRRFLALYVKYDCGVGAWQLWVDKMEKIADRHILLNYDGNLYAQPNETRNGQEWGMIVK